MSTQVIPYLATASTINANSGLSLMEVEASATDRMSLVQLPGGVADLERSEIRHDDGNRDELSGREADLLRYLAANPDRPVSRDEILQQVWHLDPRRLITRTIDMHIANLRDKLHDDPGNPKVLFTVRGEGYMFTGKRCRDAGSSAPAA
jgi:DNA-binding response OmpR family regulator